MLDARTVQFGGLNLRTLDPETLSQESIAAYEDLVHEHLVQRYQYWQNQKRVPHRYLNAKNHVDSPVIMLELLRPEPTLDAITGIRLDAFGLGLAARIGTNTVHVLAQQLKAKSIRNLGIYVDAEHAKECADLECTREIFEQSGIEIIDVDTLEAIPSDCATWCHASYGHMDPLPEKGPVRCALERSIFGPLDYRHERTFMLGLNAVPLSGFKTLQELDEKYFPQGYVVRKLSGPEATIYRCTSEPDSDWKVEEWYRTRRNVSTILTQDRSSDFIVQPLQQVMQRKSLGRKRREHRYLFFVLIGETYRLADGYDLCVREGPVELTKDTVVRPVLCS